MLYDLSHSHFYLQRFTAQPLRTTWNAFAKFTGLLTDTFIAQDPGLTMSPDFHEQLIKSLDESNLMTPIDSTSAEDPDFCLVHEKV